MSYDIHLRDPDTGETCRLDEPYPFAGGTHQLGGSREAWLNITYNYAPVLKKVLGEKGIRGLHGRVAGETIPEIEAAIEQLGDDSSEDYWKPTEGNVKTALRMLRDMAMLFPRGIWDGD